MSLIVDFVKSRTTVPIVLSAKQLGQGDHLGRNHLLAKWNLE